MMHPAALIESGDWSSVKPEVSYAAGKRHGLQMKVINAALEYFLADERADAAAHSRRGSVRAFDLSLKRREQRAVELMAACDALLKLVPNVDRRAAKRKAVRA